MATVISSRLRCWLRSRWHRLTTGARWNGHCWGPDGCIDCGKR